VPRRLAMAAPEEVRLRGFLRLLYAAGIQLESSAAFRESHAPEASARLAEWVMSPAIPPLAPFFSSFVNFWGFFS